MLLDACGPNCGWTAALISCVSFGTFAVPIKSEASQSVDVDPLVFQSYKTFMCFATSWTVLLIGQPLTYSAWGIVSGLFWVPAGVAAIYAVKHAGLAVSQGIWSCLIVLVSFGWGMFVFGEEVKSKTGAWFAVFLMIVGLLGMSFYSSPNRLQLLEDSAEGQERGQEQNGLGKTKFRNLGYTKCDSDADESDDGDLFTTEGDSEVGIRAGGNFKSSGTETKTSITHSRRLGLLAAIFNGLWGGSVMVPMHYAPDDVGGVGFVISFAIGASIITLLLWVGRFFFLLHRSRDDGTAVSFRKAYVSLPSLHLRIMWLPGGIAGMLWSIGNLCSMVSVQYLGEGVGYSVTQSAMMVSGLWGIFYFREVEGTVTRLKWLGASLMTLLGILLLSKQV